MIKITPEAMTALTETIDRWIELRDTGNRRPCPLCFVFESYGENECKGCPVMADTGLAGCVGTPWDEWVSAMEGWGRDTKHAVAVQAAGNMVEYLSGLKERCEV